MESKFHNDLHHLSQASLQSPVSFDLGLPEIERKNASPVEDKATALLTQQLINT
jgi:hypothetical protein